MLIRNACIVSNYGLAEDGSTVCTKIWQYHSTFIYTDFC